MVRRSRGKYHRSLPVDGSNAVVPGVDFGWWSLVVLLAGFSGIGWLVLGDRKPVLSSTFCPYLVTLLGKGIFKGYITSPSDPQLHVFPAEGGLTDDEKCDQRHYTPRINLPFRPR